MNAPAPNNVQVPIFTAPGVDLESLSLVVGEQLQATLTKLQAETGHANIAYAVLIWDNNTNLVRWCCNRTKREQAWAMKDVLKHFRKFMGLDV